LRLFLAGATGAVGRPLTRLLRQAGHEVAAATRSAEGAALLSAMGAEPVVIDVFDAEGLIRAVVQAAPEVVIHQLTDLSAGLDPAQATETLTRNARLRREGTANLVSALRAAGARRLIAQSIAWAYAPKTPPYVEPDPLDAGATGLRGVSVGKGVIPLENAVLGQLDFEGVVLRYGNLYGPGAWADAPKGPSPLHVDAAAYAALLALDRGLGAYNIAEPGGEAAIDKALAELGWRPDFRLDAPVQPRS
jgi:nucleoside-diphosphate-sugar epimerase